MDFENAAMTELQLALNVAYSCAATAGDLAKVEATALSDGS